MKSLNAISRITLSDYIYLVTMVKLDRCDQELVPYGCFGFIGYRHLRRKRHKQLRTIMIRLRMNKP